VHKFVHIAEGAFGALHKVEWMGGEVAVKTMRIASSTGEAASNTRDFLKEAAVLSRLKHQHVLNFVGMLNAVQVTRGDS